MTTTPGWSALADALPEPMMLVSLDGAVHAVNRALVRIIGKTQDALVGSSLSEVVHSIGGSLDDYLRLCARSRQLVPGAVRLAGRDGGDYRVEGGLLSSGGDGTALILLRFTPRSRTTGRFVALNDKIDELNQQIGRRRSTEKLLREQKEWLHGTLSSIGEGLIATDAAGRVRLMNDVAVRLTGWSSDEAAGVAHHDMFHAVDEATGEPGVSAVTEAVSKGKVVRRAQRVLTARDGKARPIQETAAPIRDEEGNVVGAVLVFRDVTRERRAEQDIRRAKEAAEAANRAKSEFLASVSHELRTPMNVVIGMTDLALEEELDSEVRDYLSTASESANNLLHLLDDLLDISRIESGKLVLRERPFRLREVVYDAVRFLSVQAAEKNLELTCYVDPGAPELLSGDAARLRQILLNLVGNGIKFTAEGEISLEVDAREGSNGRAEVHLAVRDTGIGISDVDRARIFAPFVQADSSSSRVFGGTGLGLSIVSALVDRLNGKLWVESTLHRGSTFHVALDYALEERLDPPHTDQCRNELEGAPVLIVDDNASSLRVVSSLLSGWGMVPTAVRSGGEAVQRIADAKREGRPYRLAIVDGLMPGVDGRDVVEQIDLRETPTILMASPVDRRNHSGRFDGLDVSATLDKPVMPSELVAALDAALEVDERPHPDSDDDVRPAPSSTTLRVLLAEDTPANQKLFTTLLRRAGHEVEVASDGLQAVALHREGSFDAILMDVQMPRVDGFEATRRIRAAEAGTGVRTPIIALSAHAMVGFREQCLDAGMDDYMAKPFTGAELQQHLLAVTTGLDHEQATSSLEPQSPHVASKPVVAALDELVFSDSFLERFLRDIDGLFREIRAAVDASDYAGLERAAHSLRGSSAFLHADPVTAAAAALEEIAKSGTLDGASAAVATLSQEIGRLRRALDDRSRA